MRKALNLVPSLDDRAQLVDEFGELDRKVKEFAPTVKRHEALAKLIRSWYEDHPAEEAAIAEGSLYIVQVGEKGEERGFSLGARLKIFTRLGKKKACEAFSITLKAVTSALGEAACNELASKERTGSRKLVPVMKQSAAELAKVA